MRKKKKRKKKEKRTSGEVLGLIDNYKLNKYMINLVKMNRDTTKMERKVKKIGRKVRFFATIGAVLLGIGLAFYLFYKVSAFYDQNRVIFQYPVIIKFQAPIKIERRGTPQKKETRKEEAVERQISLYPAQFEEAYDKVWLMESGRGSNKAGLNGYCIEKGMINEIGYAPHDKYCFKDREEQKSTFMTWLTNRINKVKMPWCDNVSQCLTIYSSNAYSL